MKNIFIYYTIDRCSIFDTTCNSFNLIECHVDQGKFVGYF